MNHFISCATLVALAFAVAACSGNKDDLPADNPFKSGKSERELRLEADGLYKLARRSLDSADFQGAIQRYDQILLKYPFTDYATQAQLESVYAKYRAFDADGALSTADRFLKEHPRHPAVDYVYYLKGLINYQRGDSAFDWAVDSARQDVSFDQQAFDDFGLLVHKYPGSRYVGDARARMVYLRNRIAAHELSIVKYYVRRGAPIAAAKRAEKIIADYPGAPVEIETLALLEDSYRKVGLDAQAADVRRIREANHAVTAGADGVEKKKDQKGWRWLHRGSRAPAAAPAPEPLADPATRPRTAPSADSGDPAQKPAQ